MDYILDEFQSLSLTKLFNWVCSGVMIFGGVVPFIPQYREIKRKNDAEGFSMYVCLVLLVSNILRILFWCGKRYEIPLLIQSLIMNITMLFMIHVCVTVRNKNQIIRVPDRIFTDFEWRHFWQWTDFPSYLEFLLSLTLFCGLLTFALYESYIYIETLGFLALFTEAMLAVPQLIQNYRNKSTEGMSVLMVLMWTMGDLFKTTYFIVRDSPAQFWFCGCIQIVIDIFILGQVYCYRSHTNNEFQEGLGIWYTRIV